MTTQNDSLASLDMELKRLQVLRAQLAFDDELACRARSAEAAGAALAARAAAVKVSAGFLRGVGTAVFILLTGCGTAALYVLNATPRIYADPAYALGFWVGSYGLYFVAAALVFGVVAALRPAGRRELRPPTNAVGRASYAATIAVLGWFGGHWLWKGAIAVVFFSLCGYTLLHDFAKLGMT